MSQWTLRSQIHVAHPSLQPLPLGAQSHLCSQLGGRGQGEAKRSIVVVERHPLGGNEEGHPADASAPQASRRNQSVVSRRYGPPGSSERHHGPAPRSP